MISILFMHETARIAGAENSLLLLASRLDRSRFNPCFVIAEEGPLAVELRRRDIEVVIHEFPRIRYGWGVARAIADIRNIIRAKGISIVHSNSIRTHVYGWCAARATEASVLWHQRNLLEREIIDPDRLLRFLPDRIICNSSAIANRFLCHGKLPAKVRVVFNGVDTSVFSPAVSGMEVRKECGIGQDAKVIGIASRFNQHKGHETFFKAARLVINQKPATRFLVAGGAVFAADKQREAYLRTLVADMKIADNVIFCGVRKDMPQVYAAMDIVVLTSEAEPCGRVVLEAMASAKAIVATDTGGTPEMICDGVTGLLIPPSDPVMLAEKLLGLSNTPDKASALGEAARKAVEERFSAQRNVENIEAIYKELRNG
jgi:glycosyltransferase involved in cell wall biosynthesis